MSDSGETPSASSIQPVSVAANSATVARVTPARRVVTSMPAAWQNRAQHALVRTIPQLRYQLMRLGPLGVSGVVALVATAVVAFGVLLPAQQSVFALRTELTKIGHVGVTAAKPEMGPRQFSASLPTREQIPAVLGVVLVQATAAGISLDQGRYTYSPATAARLARYTFEFPVKAEYSTVRSFINRTLEAAPALGLDKLHVERKNVGDTIVNADVGFVVYMRGA